MTDNWKLSRRSLLQGTAMGIGLVAAPSILGAQSPTKISFGHGAAPGNPRTIAAEKFAEIVKAKSGGAIEVTVAGSAQLGDDVAMLTSLRTGVLGISANSQGPASAVVPELAAFGLPFLFADASSAIKIVGGKLGDQLKPKFDAVGLVPLGFWDNGIRHITNSKRAINSPEDLKGLKIRTPADPATIDIFQALGAGTAQIAFSELYIALQQGVVDGQENPLTNIASAKLFEVNKYISMSAHKWESTPVLMSKAVWSRLDKKGQDIVMAAAAEAGSLQVKLSEDANAKLVNDFKANANVAVNSVDRDAFRKATASVFDKWQEKPFGAFVKDLRASVGA
ncbi:TRAP transporter substrate-binding protein [Undibacter mobilis]|uniref:TRAP transporter substrate-binding protein n=1 Tax=Undibacter mobilis TaxID=2292256 RepID=A0A371BAA8_9BRAD|nr:TRAP transporter substrate-binding protein [Undibacter mobilis]RDV04510.1 TRAP transporter substrate-binding protein [Undibacter mobilis]